MHIGMQWLSILEKAAISALRKLSDLLVNFIIPFGNWCIYHSQSPSPNHCLAIKKCNKRTIIYFNSCVPFNH